MTYTERDLATLIWRACLDAGHPITVPASHDAATAALDVLDPPPPLTRRPQLMVDLHEAVPWNQWDRPGQLARTLRAHADRLDQADQSDAA